MQCLPDITYNFLNPALANSIDNMERTKASLITTILDPNLDADNKQNKLLDLKLKLLDKERMVINDKRLFKIQVVILSKLLRI